MFLLPRYLPSHKSDMLLRQITSSHHVLQTQCWSRCLMCLKCDVWGGWGGVGHIHVRWNLHHVCATGAVNGPAGFAVFLLSHCASVRSIARMLEVLHVSYIEVLPVS